MITKFGLGKQELQLLAEIISGSESRSLSELGKKLGVSKAEISRSAKNLAEKGFVTVERKGKRKKIGISSAPHAFAFREMAAGNSHVNFKEILAYSALQVLSGMLFAPASVEDVSRITNKPEITVRRVLSNLLMRGIVAKVKPKRYAILLPRLKEFIGAYVLYALETKREGTNGSLICRGPDGLLRTTGKPKEFMVPTGISVFSQYGVSIVQNDFKDYRFGVFEEKAKRISMEEAIVHALLRSTVIASGREVSYSLLVLHKNIRKVNKPLFLQVANDFGVYPIAEKCLEMVEKYEHGEPWMQSISEGKGGEGSGGFRLANGPFFPGREEFDELVKQYA